MKNMGCYRECCGEDEREPGSGRIFGGNV